MTNDKIKNQIERYLKEYQKNSGTFEGFRVIFDFVGLLKSEPYIQKIMGEIFKRAESQKQVMLKMKETKELDKYDTSKMVVDIKDPLGSSVPVFTQENESWQNKIKNQEDLNFYILLPIYLLDLIIIYDLMAKAKDNIKANNSEEANRLAKIAKEESFSLAPFTIKDEKGDSKNVSVSTASFHLECMALIGKYILDNINAEEFLTSNKPKSAVSFDKNKSLLYILGQEIKITRKGDKPNDHYILEAIFDQEDLTEEVYFKDIAKKYLGMDDYDKTKDWAIFRHACDRLNAKVAKAVDNAKDNFIVYSIGNAGWCKINQKYL